MSELTDAFREIFDAEAQQRAAIVRAVHLISTVYYAPDRNQAPVSEALEQAYKLLCGQQLVRYQKP
jgi:hypothetical protein